jgi:hypothetical protein
MRLPVGGGTPELVFESATLINFRCAAPPATLCICTEASQNGVIISRLDPLHGKGTELVRAAASSGDGAISPDGKHIARIVLGEKTGRIRIVSASGDFERDLSLPDWLGLNSIDWTGDSKRLFVGTWTPEKGATLLHVDLSGKAIPVWNQPGSFRTWAVPSPDGQKVAMLTGTTDANAWMIEVL